MEDYFNNTQIKTIKSCARNEPVHTTMAKITLKRDNSIELKQGAFAPRIIGKWKKKDVWAENGGKRDKSGNKLVHYIWCATLRRGIQVEAYTREELIDFIKQDC